MGKRSAAGELFLGNMGSIQRETRPSIQREDQLTMETKLEQIAAKARREPKLRFTSLAHHITRDRVRKNLLQIPKRSAAGVDGQTVEAAKKSFDGWIEPMLQSIPRQGYRAPDIRRVYIPKPGKTEKHPLGVPIVADRALQGGFKRSSQHPGVGGCDEHSKAAVGSVWTSAIAVAGSAPCGGAR